MDDLKKLGSKVKKDNRRGRYNPTGRKPGRPKKLKVEQAARTIEEQVQANMVRIEDLLKAVRVKFDSLDRIALAFIERGVQLIGELKKPTEAFSAAKILMEIRRLQFDLEAHANTTAAQVGQVLRFATPDELELELATMDAQERIREATNGQFPRA